MTCEEEIVYFQNISTTLLCLQGLFVIIFFVLSKEKRNLDVLFLLGLIFLHPVFYKKNTDCGEEIFQNSLLFFGTSVVLIIGFYYRENILRRMKKM